MKDSAIVILRAFLVMIFLGAFLGQLVIVPAFANESTAAFPELAFLAAPYTIVVNAGIACLQVMGLAIWILLSMVQRDVIFTSQAFRWVNVIIWSAAGATMLVLSLGVHLLGVMQVGGPGVLLAIGGATICGTAFVLLMLVMRGLLHNATTMENELAKLYNVDIDA
ncbi:DUF2975 domain-containing protein [Arthrobacter sp. GMC3]|uniref:DUF2975 domain-containing protein n=1 Tax=Arthrobacter sp. GMC3 TaxID=2058894 RepID=UPI000CE3438B|nr:DUF2975 domain-containing protein [Arthrobacter sp. GMC3]